MRNRNKNKTNFWQSMYLFPLMPNIVFWKFLLIFQIFQFWIRFLIFIHQFIIFVSSICHVHTFAKICQVLLIIFELSWLKCNFYFYFFVDRQTDQSFWEAWPVKKQINLASPKKITSRKSSGNKEDSISMIKINSSIFCNFESYFKSWT